MVIGPYSLKSQIEIVTEQSVAIYIYIHYKVKFIFVYILSLHSDLKIQSRVLCIAL